MNQDNQAQEHEIEKVKNQGQGQDAGKVNGQVRDQEGNEAQNQKKGTVLLVEDDLPMIKMYSTKLEKEGFRVEAAHDGKEGWEKIKSQQADLIVLDLMIPKIGGMELLEKIKTDSKLKETPVVILSNLSQQQDIARASELGVEHFLIKSNYTPSQVVKIIKSYF